MGGNCGWVEMLLLLGCNIYLITTTVLEFFSRLRAKAEVNSLLKSLISSHIEKFPWRSGYNEYAIWNLYITLSVLPHSKKTKGILPRPKWILPFLYSNLPRMRKIPQKSKIPHVWGYFTVIG